MRQSIHELLPEMAWRAGMLYRLDEIIKLLQSIEAGLPIKLEASANIDLTIPDDIGWESVDVTDYVSM